MRCCRHAFVPLFLFCCCAIAPMAAAEKGSTDAQEQETAIAVLRAKATDFAKAKACEKLALVGDAGAVEPLAELLSHPRLGDYALSALVRIPGQQVDHALLSAVPSLRERSLMGVLHAIGERQIVAAVPLLQIELGKRSWSDAEQLAVIQTLGAIGTPPAEAVLKQMNVSDRKGRFQRVHADALQRCTMPLPNREAELQRLLADLQAGDVPYRAALGKARRLGTAAAPTLAQSLRSADPGRQSLTLICLADLGNPQILDVCRPLMQSEHAGVAAQAVETVAVLGGFSNAERLPDFVLKKPEQVVSMLRSIAMADNPAIDHQIIGMIQGMANGGDEDPRWRSAVIQYLVQRRLSAATLPLLKLASRTRKSGQDFLMAAAATVTIDQFPALLKQVGELADDDRDSASQILQAALVHLPQDATANLLGTAIESSRQTARSDWYLDQLAFLGGPKSLALVVAYARSGNEHSLGDDSSLDAATRVLGEWTTADVAAPLLQLVDQLPAGKYQLRALRGYLRVGRQLDMEKQDRLELCMAGWQRAQRDDERLLVLDILRRNSSKDGMIWLVDLLHGKSRSGEAGAFVHSQAVRNRAFLTLAYVAGRVAMNDPQQVKQVLSQLDFTRAPASAAETLEALR